MNRTDFLTPEALADRWRIKPDTLSQWRWNGRGPVFLKIGSRVLYRLDEIEKFEEDNIRQNTSQTANPFQGKA